MIKCISDVCKYIPSLPNGGTHQKVIFVKPKHNTAPSLSRESHREEARVGVGRVFVLQDYNSELLSYGRGEGAAVLFLAHYCHQPCLEVCQRKFAIVLTIFGEPPNKAQASVPFSSEVDSPHSNAYLLQCL